MSQKQIRLTCVVPKSDDPTSFYRAFGPLGELRKTIPGLEFNLPNVYSWATMGVCDAIFMQRPADPQCLQIAQIAKLTGTPLWIDFDDDNLAVPESNETHEFFGQWNIKDTIVKCSRLADVITVSTEFLRKKYSIYNKNIFVIPNSINERYLPLRNIIPKRPRDKVILWRGGPGFHANIAEIVPSINKLAAANPTWKWVFMGHNPYEIKVKNKQFIPWMDYLSYLQAICQLHPTTFIYCLEPNDHSLSRSNCIWLEATFAGSVALCKALPEFDRPGCLTFQNAEEFEAKMTGIMNKEIDVEAKYQESWDHISKNYMLSQHNVGRKEILEKLVGAR